MGCGTSTPQQPNVDQILVPLGDPRNIIRTRTHGERGLVPEPKRTNTEENSLIDSNRKTELYSQYAETLNDVPLYHDQHDENDDDEAAANLDCSLGKRKQHIIAAVGKSLEINLDEKEKVKFGLLCERICGLCGQTDERSAEEKVDILRRHLHLDAQATPDSEVGSKRIRHLLMTSISYATPNFTEFFAQHSEQCGVCLGDGLPKPLLFPDLPSALVQRKLIHQSIVTALLTNAQMIIVHGRIGDGKKTAVHSALLDPQVRAIANPSIFITLGENADLLSKVQDLAINLPEAGPVLSAFTDYRKYFKSLPMKPKLTESQLQYLSEAKGHPSTKLATRVLVLQDVRSSAQVEKLRETLCDRFTFVLLVHKEFLPNILVDDDFDLIKVEVPPVSHSEAHKLISLRTSIDLVVHRETFNHLVESSGRSITVLSVLTALLDAPKEVERMCEVINYWVHPESVDHMDGPRQRLLTILHAGMAFMPQYWLAPYLDFALFKEGTPVPRCLLLLLWRRRFPEIGWERPNRLPEIIAMIHGYITRDFFSSRQMYSQFFQHELMCDWAYSMANQTILESEEQHENDHSKEYRGGHKLLVRQYQKAFKSRGWATVLDGADSSENLKHEYMRKNIGYHLREAGDLLELKDQCLARHALLWLAEQGDVESIKEVLRCPGFGGKNKWHKATDNKRGRSALLLACAHGHSVLVTLLLEKNADVGEISRLGETGLQLAAQHNHVRCVELLLKSHAHPMSLPRPEHQKLLDTIQQSSGKEEPREIARKELFFVAMEAMGPSRSKKLRVSELIAFLAESSPATVPDKLFKHLVAGDKQDLDLTQELSFNKAYSIWRDVVSETAPINVACINAFNKLLDRNPLPLAAAEGNEAIVNKLIEDIKKISVSRTSSRNTFNKVASSSSSEGKTMSRSSSAALLVVEGQLNRRLGESLVEAARFGHVDVVKQLLVAKATPNAKANGTTALVAAATSSHNKAMELLIEFKVDVNQRDDRQRSALQNAVENAHLQTALTLLKVEAKAAGAFKEDTGKAKKDGSFNVKSELLCAVEQGQDELLIPLLNAKASVNKIFKFEGVNGVSLTILDAALAAGNAETVKLLLNHNADPNILRPPNQQVLKELVGNLQEWV